NDGVPAWSGGRLVVSRMLRRGRYKLIYHRGHSEQLFDLETDPEERNDLAGRREFREIQESMRERLLSDWDPEAIAAKVEAHKAEHAMLAAWARAVQPAEILRWQMKPADNWLSDAADLERNQ